jgi:hypothetical protein
VKNSLHIVGKQVEDLLPEKEKRPSSVSSSLYHKKISLLLLHH